MNITSACKSLRLILAFCSSCLFFLNTLHAQGGEQDNWYLAKELPIGSIPKDCELWKDPSDSIYKLIYAASSDEPLSVANEFYKQDLLGNKQMVNFTLEGNSATYQFDESTSYSLENPNKITYFRNFVVLSDGSLLIDANVEFDWGLENPYSIACLLHASLVDQTAKVLKHGRVPLAFGGSNKLLLSFEVQVPDPESPLTPIIVTYYEVAQVEFPSDGEISLTTEGNFTIPSGTSPGMLYSNELNPQITFDDRIVFIDFGYFSSFDLEGSFLHRVRLDGINETITLSPRIGIKGLFITRFSILNQFGHEIFNFARNGISLERGGIWSVTPFMTAEGNLILETYKGTHDASGGFSWSTSVQQWNRAYRTKGLPEPNAIPQPLVHSVKQRAGTNILDIDFEIVDPDDDTAKVGILASTADFSLTQLFDNQLIIPNSLVDGTESKIGNLIATNQVHRVSWYVKGDWDQLYGDLKIGVFAQDSQRNKPTDIHFLTLPIGENGLTISRSSIDVSIVDKFLLHRLSLGELAFESRSVYNDILGEDQIVPALVRKSDDEILAMTIEGGSYSLEGASGFLLEAFGEGYRWATDEEVQLAKEAATPGQVNSFQAKNQIMPRGLPGAVNEYGFDTFASDTYTDLVYQYSRLGWSKRWIVKEN